MNTISNTMEQDLLTFEYLLNDLGSINSFDERDYSYIVEHLRSCHKNHRSEMINTGLNFVLDGYHMTGLEWAVYRNDWKTAAILVYFGADPRNNIFDGTAKFERALLEMGAIFPGFEEPHVIPGFEGLDLLVYDHHSDGNDHGRAHLWLMETVLSWQDKDDANIAIHEMLPELLNNIELVSDDLQFTRTECAEFVRNVLLCMNRFGLPNELAMRVMEESLMSKLWFLLRDFGLSGIDDGW